MLPDFPNAKKVALRGFLRAVRAAVPHHEPILAEVKRTTIHEGRQARLVRADQSVDDMEYQQSSAELILTREEMHGMTVSELVEKISGMSQELAGQQVQVMFERLSEAVESVGNTVSAAEMGNKEAFLEMQRKIEVEFDPETLEPKGMVIVLHPSQMEKFKAEAEEWQKDPVFVEEMTSIRQQQIEAWRARENRRILAD